MQGSIILVAIDFQEASLAALARARDLGKRLGLEVVLLHVHTIPIVFYPGFEPIAAPGLLESVAAAAKQSLEELARSAGGLRTILRAGEPVPEILAAINETQPEMLVLGTHGRKGISHLLLGSVAEKVLRMSPVPVLTVRAPTT